ncbi:MAG: 7-cyano-7-deazaguanine synthase QueC [Gammaproteobacteria bacterium]|nr:7-cyano-7-deazaguanine synthase QueC [Gammaproteobacteria bacterium]
MSDKAVILLSGGLDSATVLAIAQQRGYQCHAISFDYGQRHKSELTAAKRVAQAAAVTQHLILPMALDLIGGSALTDTQIEVPVHAQSGIPVTYVPARNTIFLSLALGWAEVLHARHIFIGVNALDYSGYPDCRPAFIEAFEKLANVATKAGVEGDSFTIEAPLLHLSKAQIIQQGLELGIDYRTTISCYQADEQGRACGQCDSCRLRHQGFVDAGLEDQTLYQIIS